MNLLNSVDGICAGSLVIFCAEPLSWICAASGKTSCADVAGEGSLCVADGTGKAPLCIGGVVSDVDCCAMTAGVVCVRSVGEAWAMFVEGACTFVIDDLRT